MLRALFRRPPAPAGDDDKASVLLPEAALLVHAARQDEVFDAAEREVILAYLTAQHGLGLEAARVLLAQAEHEEEKSADLFSWTRQINRQCSLEKKQALLEALWRVVFADGKKDMFESSLLRRLAGLLHISDYQAAQARQAAQTHLTQAS